MEALHKKCSSFSAKLNDSIDLIGEKDRVIEILKDELQAHQLELSQREVQWRESKKKCQELETENKSLIDRWLTEKQEQAAKMDEANEYIQRYIPFHKCFAIKKYKYKAKVGFFTSAQLYRICLNFKTRCC